MPKQGAAGGRRLAVRQGFSVRIVPNGIALEVLARPGMSAAQQRALDAKLAQFDGWQSYDAGAVVAEAALPPHTDIAGLLASGHLAVVGDQDDGG